MGNRAKFIKNLRHCRVYSFDGSFVVGELREVESDGQVEGVFLGQPRRYADWEAANSSIQIEVQRHYDDRRTDSDDWWDS